jgi:hypothetical protein
MRTRGFSGTAYVRCSHLWRSLPSSAPACCGRTTVCGPWVATRFHSGAKGIRIPDLRRAKAALCETSALIELPGYVDRRVLAQSLMPPSTPKAVLGSAPSRTIRVTPRALSAGGYLLGSLHHRDSQLRRPTERIGLPESGWAGGNGRHANDGGRVRQAHQEHPWIG